MNVYNMGNMHEICIQHDYYMYIHPIVTYMHWAINGEINFHTLFWAPENKSNV